MDEVVLQDAVDRYLRMEMTQQERIMFEELRRNNPEVDQLVVAHSFFLQELERYGGLKEFKGSLNEVEAKLLEEGTIKAEQLTIGGKVVNMWKRYKRTIAVAACIGGITAICISAIMESLSPKPDAKLIELVNKVQRVENSQRAISQQFNELKELKTKIDPKAELKGSGTSFLIDGRGYLVTNAHVVKDVSSVYVQNMKGDNFRARIIYTNSDQDIAVLKIDDSDFRSVGPLPYGIKRSGGDLGENILILGYPRNEIVCGLGYLSSITGFNGDTLSCQITVSANPGNSGGPVLNEKGEVIGILSTKQVQADGAVFALKSKYIYAALDSLRKDTSNTYPNIRVSSVSTIGKLDRVQQIRKVEDCVYMVKGY